MVREEGLDLLRRAEPALRHQPAEQLRVVDDLVVPAVLRVLVAERVEAVRAVRDDLGDPDGVHRLDVLLRERLEQELVAHPPGGVAGAELPRARGSRTRPRLAASSSATARQISRARSSNEPAHPTQYRYSGAAPFTTGTSSPSAQSARCDCATPPRVRAALQVAQHGARLGREPRLAHHQGPAEVDDRVDVLDVHRALLHARAARRARPDDVVVDDARHERQLLGRLAGGQHLQDVRALPRAGGRAGP